MIEMRVSKDENHGAWCFVLPDFVSFEAGSPASYSSDYVDDLDEVYEDLLEQKENS
jgi:hypothetical protein